MNDVKRPTSTDDPIPGKYPEFALEVRRILDWDGGPGKRISSRAAARKTGISHGMIALMVDGNHARMELIIKFAYGMNADVNRLLRAAGYPEIKDPADVYEQLRTFLEHEPALASTHWPTDPDVQRRIWDELRRLRAMVQENK